MQVLTFKMTSLNHRIGETFTTLSNLSAPYDSGLHSLVNFTKIKISTYTVHGFYTGCLFMLLLGFAKLGQGFLLNFAKNENVQHLEKIMRKAGFMRNNLPRRKNVLFF
jgi:hypothetical protein